MPEVPDFSSVWDSLTLTVQLEHLVLPNVNTSTGSSVGQRDCKHYLGSRYLELPGCALPPSFGQVRDQGISRIIIVCLLTQHFVNKAAGGIRKGGVIVRVWLGQTREKPACLIMYSSQSKSMAFHNVIMRGRRRLDYM